MTTLPMQAPHVPQDWAIPGLGRVVTAVLTVLDVLTEAQQQARAAHARFPFADW